MTAASTVDTPGDVTALVGPAYHAKSIPACLEYLKSSQNGLTPEEVKSRLKTHGKNVVVEKGAKRRSDIALKPFTILVLLILAAACALSFYLNHINLAIGFGITFLTNISMFLLGHLKSQQTITQQETLGSKFCLVKRDKKKAQVATTELVPGDIIVLSSGQVVPADCRLIESERLQVDEALLTGESTLVLKDASSILDPNLEESAQSNMIFAGTLIKTGRGEALVTTTGKKTLIGNVMELTAHTRRKHDPFTRSLNQVSLMSFAFALVFTGIILFIQTQRDVPQKELIEWGLLLTVCALPQTLPSMLTIIFASVIERLSRLSILIKDLHALLGLGHVTTICTDKTGTLTENTPRVTQFFLPEKGMVDVDERWAQGEAIPNKSVETALRIAKLHNTTVMEGLRSFAVGDPMDMALFRVANSNLQYGYKKVKEYPFDPQTLRTSMVFKQEEGQYIAFIKGAPEAILEVSHFYLKSNGETAPLEKTLRQEWALKFQEYALEQSVRIIGFAQKPLSSDNETPDSMVTFVGFVCLADPPKPGVMETIQSFHDLGLKVIMITGDQKATAAVTARELGILTDGGSQVWTHQELLAQAAPNKAVKIPANVRVFARTKPEEKLAIVETLQRSGEQVAMIGDGVNDTPALQKCDVAVAMGIHGAESAKESASLILLNDRLEGITAAIIESRHIARTINTMVKYLLSFNVGLVVLLLGTLVFGLTMPLKGIQILWLNLVTVSFPVLYLAFQEGPTDAEIQRLIEQDEKGSALAVQQKVLSGLDLFFTGFWGLVLAGAGISAFLLGLFVLKMPENQAITFTFTTLALTQLLNILNTIMVRAEGDWQRMMELVFSAPMLWLVTLGGVFGQILALSIEPIRSFLEATPLETLHWAMAAGIALATIAVTLSSMDFKKSQG